MAFLLRAGGLARSCTVAGHRGFHVLASRSPTVAVAPSLLQTAARKNSIVDHSFAQSRRHWTSWLGGSSSTTPVPTVSEAGEDLKDLSPSYGALQDSGDKTASALDAVGNVSSANAVEAASEAAVTAADSAASAAAPVAAKTMLSGPSLSSSAWYYLPMASVQAFVVYLHTVHGLPIWACLGAVAITLRLTLVPIQIQMLKCGVVLQNHMPQLNALQSRTLMATKRHDDEAIKRLKAEADGLFKKMGCTPWTSLRYSTMMMPFQVACFFAIRDMCLGLAATSPVSMQTGGFFWAPDLTIPDPYFVMPVLLSAVFLTAVMLGSENGMRPTGWMKHFLIGISIAGAGLTSQFPMGLQIFWLFNISMGVSLSRLYRWPSVRPLLGMPDMVEHPDGVVKPGINLEQIREFFTSPSGPPGKSASQEERMKFIAKGLEEKMKEDAKRRQKTAHRFKGLDEGLTAARGRQSSSRKDSG
ncbi:uncharacterized protein LOC135819873 [Sycon ciliatum]|uniref:uncharacterized protein LOC135819873 n=1 Tax=Sycon ciliatum TaxID=27933 RepID=UPI0031F5F9D7|eukprot:scpid58401/ scgid6467/ Mitochondrial inner membrane protein OXA1L; Oxidase assembly 1-like protein